MPDLILHSPDNPDFARVLPLRQVRDLDEFAVDIAPTEAEAAALARLVGATALRKMRLQGRLTPAGAGWRFDGRLGATVVQPCVVSLDPVTTRIDVPVRRHWLPEAGRPAAELVVSVDDDEDEPEPLADRIDLGLVATEALALAVPDYPRKPGAALAPAADTADEQDVVRPFASLAALRAKLGDDG